MPSMINELVLKELQDQITEAPAYIVVDPAGLKADESLALRRKLFDAGASLKQAKARIVALAVAEEAAPHCKGQGSLAVVTGEDIAAAAKVLRELAKEEKVSFKAGFIEGAALDASGADRLADLPSKHEARAMVVKAIRAPAVKLAKVLRAPYRKLGRIASVRKDKLEEG